MEKLPKEFKEKWIAALRSGGYKQGKCRLEKNGAYCCLGVAGKIAHPEINITNEQFLSARFVNVPNILKGDTSPEIYALTEMNDVKSNSFSEIAEWIEDNL